MKKRFIAVGLIAILGFSCSSNNQEDSQEPIEKTEAQIEAEKKLRNTPRKNYKIDIKMNIDELVKELTEGKDIAHLSYTHGIATAQQLLREKLEFINIDKFASEVAAYENGSKTPKDKMIVSQELQAIAQSSNNFQNLTPEDGDKVVEGIASLYYTLFINDPSFSNLDIEQYQKGLKEYWKTQKIENEQALAEEYFTYKATFSKDLGKKFLAKNKLRPEVTETESGLQYEVLQEGSGANPSDTNEVTVHYQGELIDGKIFDSSYQRGETISFGLNQVIKGWTEGLQLMNNGAKYRLYIPYEIGYGERGTQGIPPFATLIFDVELFSFK